MLAAPHESGYKTGDPEPSLSQMIARDELFNPRYEPDGGGNRLARATGIVIRPAGAKPQGSEIREELTTLFRHKLSKGGGLRILLLTELLT